MQKRSIQIILIVSLSFNLAFIGFGLFRYFQMRKFADPRLMFRHAPKEIRDNFRQHREVVDPIKEEIETIRRQFIAELKKPDFDEDRLQKKLESYLAKQAELERIMGNNFIEMRKNLTVEQLEDFFSHFPKMNPPHPEQEKFSKPFRRQHEKND